MTISYTYVYTYVYAFLMYMCLRVGMNRHLHISRRCVLRAARYTANAGKQGETGVRSDASRRALSAEARAAGCETGFEGKQGRRGKEKVETERGMRGERRELARDEAERCLCVVCRFRVSRSGASARNRIGVTREVRVRKQKRARRAEKKWSRREDAV